jgi:hypothetical protein
MLKRSATNNEQKVLELKAALISLDAIKVENAALKEKLRQAAVSISHVYMSQSSSVSTAPVWVVNCSDSLGMG